MQIFGKNKKNRFFLRKTMRMYGKCDFPVGLFGKKM